MADRFGLGVNPSDFGWLANQYNPATLDQGGQEAAAAAVQAQQQAVAALGDTGARLAAQKKAEAVPPLPQNYQVKTKPDGSTEISLSGLTPDQLQYFQKASQFYQQALGGYAQEAQRLEAQTRQAEGQPWQQLATALAANLAQAPDMPGWVQGLGRTAAQLNPTLDELRARKMAVMGKEAEIAEKGMALGIAQERTIEERNQRQIAEATAVEKQRQLSVERFVDNAKESIKAGTGDVNVGEILKGLAVAGATPQELKANEALLGNLATNIGRKWQAEQTAKAEALALSQKNYELGEKRFRLLEQAAATKASDKSEEQKDLEALAQSLAAGELTSLRTVASMRGGRRERVFRLAREIDPNFNTAEIDRKIKTEELFTLGPRGNDIRSFGTFLQHGGEAVETIKGIDLMSSKLANKTLNWWRANMTDSPELMRLQRSVEVVGIEFQKFLLGTQYALQKEDRERIKDFIKGDMPLKQMAATLNQMGRIADERMVEFNHQYKKVMKHDLQDPFSPEAMTGAEKMGVKLSIGGASEQPTAVNEKTGEVLVWNGKAWIPKK